MLPDVMGQPLELPWATLWPASGPSFTVVGALGRHHFAQEERADGRFRAGASSPVALAVQVSERDTFT
jgi:hypothetical protein